MRATIAQRYDVMHLSGSRRPLPCLAINTQWMRTQIHRTNPLPSPIIPTTRRTTTPLINLPLCLLFTCRTTHTAHMIPHQPSASRPTTRRCSPPHFSHPAISRRTSVNDTICASMPANTLAMLCRLIVAYPTSVTGGITTGGISIADLNCHAITDT